MFDTKNYLVYILIAINIYYLLSNKLKESYSDNYIKHGDIITIRSHTGKRLQDTTTNAKFNNYNRGAWEKMHIEKCGHAGIGHTPNNC